MRSLLRSQHRRLIAFFLVTFVAFSCKDPSSEEGEGGPAKERADEQNSGQDPKGSAGSGQTTSMKGDEDAEKEQKGASGGKGRNRAQSPTTKKMGDGKGGGRGIKEEKSPVQLREIFEKPAQRFRFNPREKITLHCDEGTEIRVAAHSFVKKNGRPIRGKVEVRVKEHYDNASMLKADLGTRSKEKLLRTKGMIQIEASANGAPCRLKDRRSLGVSFPGLERKSNMKLFTASRDPAGRMDWQLESSSSIVREKKYRPVTNDRLPKLKGGRMNLKVFILAKGNYPDRAVDKKIEGKVVSMATITSGGAVKDLEVKESPDPILSQAAMSVLKKMPDWKPGRLGEENVSVRLAVPIRFAIGEKRQHAEVFLDSSYDARAALERKALEVSKRVFRTRELGWINCDEFRDMENLVAQRIQLEEKGVALRMLFKERKSLVRSKHNGSLHLFERVPKGKKVQLIAIGKEGEKYRWASEEMFIGGPDPDLEFETLSKAEMEERMKGLNGI